MIYWRTLLKRRSFWYLIGSVALFFLIGTFPYWKTTLAKFAWYRMQNASLAIFLKPADSQLLFDLGNYYFNGGAYDLKQAEELYGMSREINAAQQGVSYQLSRLKFLEGDFPSAIYFINKEIELYPDFKRSYYMRGLINAYADNLPEAEQDFKVFLEFDSNSWAAYNDLAFVYWKMNNYELMQEVAERGLLINPGNAWLLITLGNAMMNLKKNTEALNFFEEAEASIQNLTEDNWRKAYPGHYPGEARNGLDQMRSILYFNKGLIYERLGQPQEAIIWLQKLIDLGSGKTNTSVKIIQDKVDSLKGKL
jgi:tetratricopeptide (TPR) repeat protein